MPPAFIVSRAECGMDNADAVVTLARSEHTNVEEMRMVQAGFDLSSSLAS